MITTMSHRLSGVRTRRALLILVVLQLIVACSVASRPSLIGISNVAAAAPVTVAAASSPSPAPSPSPSPKPKPSRKPVVKAAVAQPRMLAATPRAYVASPPPPPFGVYGLPTFEPATIAFPAANPMKLYDSPSTKAHYTDLSGDSTYGSERVMMVVEHRGTWDQVLLPSKPNGRRAWVQSQDVGEKVINLRIDIFVSQERLVLRDGNDVLLVAEIGDGAPSTQTPLGTFYVTDVTAPADTSGPYGPRAYGTSAFSNDLSSFDGQPPQIAIHGTNQPYLIPGHVSNGCIRLHNADIEKMMPIVQLGTPVYIHA